MIATSSRYRKWLKRAAVGAIVLVVLWLASAFLVAYARTWRPHRLFAEPPPTVSWAAIEPVRIRTTDGLELGAWYMPGRPDASVVLLHGFRSDRSESLPLAKTLVDNGCSVFAVTMRAHGDSEGNYNDVGFRARQDVAAAVDRLETQRPGKPVFIQGTSMGAAAAIFAAEELQSRVSGYILECPYRDICSAVRNRTAKYLSWPLNHLAYAGLRLVGPIFMPEMDRMAPVDRVAEIPQSIPVLVMAGGRDDRALPDEVEAIYRRIATHAQLIVFPDAVHGRFSTQGGDVYRAAVVDFVRKK